MSTKFHHILSIDLETKNVKMLYDTLFIKVKDACVASKIRHLKRGLTPMAWYDEQNSNKYGAYAIGPFYKGEVSGHLLKPMFFTSDQFNSANFSVDVDWLVATACGLLNDEVWQLWQNELINENGEPFKSICGFTGLTDHGPETATLFNEFSKELTYGSPPGSDSLWKNNNVLTNDQAVKAWMQSACRLLRKGDAAVFIVGEAAACDFSNRYIINSRKIRRFRTLWLVEEDWYEIISK